MKNLFAIQLLPSLVFALGTLPIPSPKDYLEENIPLLAGTSLPDSTWVVLDAESKLWSSRDHGANWEPLPLDSQDSEGEIVGGVVVSSDRLSTWSMAGGWTPMVLPTSYATSDDSYFGSLGDRGILDDIAGRIRYYRSKDGMKTWADWLSLDTSSVPSGSSVFGDMQLGRIWYLVPDSGYVRGTSNGTTWTKSVLPTGFEPSRFEPDAADTALQLVGHLSDEPVLARSGPLGAPWRILPLSAPGGTVRQLAPGLWCSSTTTDLETLSELWLSRSPAGNWSRVEAGGINEYFVAQGEVLLATDSGLLQVDLSQSNGAIPRSKTIHGIRRAGTRLEIEIAPGPGRIRWSLHAIDGSVLGTGSVKPGRNDIFCPPGAAWIRIGSTASRVPPY